MIAVMIGALGLMQVIMASSGDFFDWKKVVYIFLYMGLLWAWAIKRSVIRERGIWPKAHIMLPFLMFAGYLYSVVPVNGMIHGASLWAAYRAVVRLSNLFLFVVVCTEIRDVDDAWRLLLFLGSVCVLISLKELMVVRSLARTSTLYSMEGTTEISSAAYQIGLGIILPVSMIRMRRKKWAPFLSASLFLLLLRNIVSISRTELVVLGVIIISTFYLYHKYHDGRKTGLFPVAAAGIALAIAAVLAVSFFSTNVSGVLSAYSGRFDVTQRSIGRRGLEYHAALAKISGDPLMGAGSGVVLQFVRSSREMVEHSAMHNFAIWYLYIGGIIGLSLFLFFIAQYYRVAIGLFRKAQGNEIALTIASASFIGVTVVLLNSALETFIQTNEANYILGILIGEALSLNRILQKKRMQ